MNDQQREELRSLEFDRNNAVKSLTKAGKEDGLEIAYANICSRIVALRHAAGEAGVLGVRRDKYRIGTS